MKNAEIIVVGGGIAGLTAALSLAQKGKDVLLLEKNEVCGGLMNTFTRDGFRFEGGARALVNAGLVKPLIKEFGLDVELLPNPITLGVEDTMLAIEGEQSLHSYAGLLKKLYPGSEAEVDGIIKAIHDIIEDMKVLYGVDNPLFTRKRKNLITLVPSMVAWTVKFFRTMYRISRMDTPFEESLDALSSNQSLKDIIGQHFFRKTPVFFALSYFALYNDYVYPRGGVGAFIGTLVDAIRKRGGQVLTDTRVSSVDSHAKIVTDAAGNEYGYKKMIWAGDLKTLYAISQDEGLGERELATFRQTRDRVLAHRGAESVFSVFLAVDMPPEAFAAVVDAGRHPGGGVATGNTDGEPGGSAGTGNGPAARPGVGGHLFYTPDRHGLGTVNSTDLAAMLARWDAVSKDEVYAWLDAYCRYNTYEISIPALRDADAAPAGKTGVILSALFDYELTRRIRDAGWYDEFRDRVIAGFVQTLSASLYPGLKDKIMFSFAASPVSIQERVESSEGSIVGWSFESEIPVVTSMFRMADSVKTALPDVFAAGKWVYSPAGGPTAIMTGRIAAKSCLKG